MATLATSDDGVTQAAPAATAAAVSRSVMRFRPCIDLHDGKVKQIVGGTLTAGGGGGGGGDTCIENFVSEKPADYFAEHYRRDQFPGGHVIMLGKGNDEAARAALKAFPGGLQVGGGITAENAASWIEAGASHVIVTSFVFKDGRISMENLEAMVSAVGKTRLVLDLSCRRKAGDTDGPYYVVTDRWQKYTDYPVNPTTLRSLSNYCAEFLVHGVEVEGKRQGILGDLVALLGEHSPLPVTYAGGVQGLEDLDLVKALGRGRVDLTIGSALDLFGGSIPYARVVEWQRLEELEQGAEGGGLPASLS
mmetsp:Transcript_56159/g.127520  ORF Transcript_56159/g.127520 Transcript_56159/m.127520 type:complete len:306 (+) Transcript_56159:225-1142(+)